MTSKRPNSLIEVAEKFDLGGSVTDVIRHKVGHINETYIVFTENRSGNERHILQKINDRVFCTPDLLMNNIKTVTEAVKRRVDERGGDPKREALSLVSTKSDEHFHVTDEGEYFRCYLYVDGMTYDYVNADNIGRALAEEAARAFSDFQGHLKDTDVGSIHVTIEDFHNTPKRFSDLIGAASGDPMGRREKAMREIDFCLSREPLANVISDAIKNGEIPIRVTHNDTKINNVIFDGEIKKRPSALCVIDLDTVMPGSILFDFGDMVRSTTCPASEDERDLNKISVDTGLFEAIVCGYLKGAEGFINNREVGLMAVSGSVLTFETGIRFLTDYLLGDRYFRTDRPDHNLDRARTQFRMVECMENMADEMEGIVGRYIS